MIDSSLNNVLLISSLIGIIIYLIANEQKRNTTEKNTTKREETIAFVTHEMRTSLTSTSWVIRLILQNYSSVLAPNDRKMLEDLAESIDATTMHSINLLDMSLIDIGKLSINLKPVSLEKIQEGLEEVVKKYSYGAKEKSINITSDVQLDHTRETYADPIRLRIVIENLLENSIQYIRKDIRNIHVSIKNTETDLSIVLSDTGIGIPRDEQEKIFSEFYRASNAKKESNAGSGIGLFMCEQYVKAHNGTIRFESKEGEGTTFFITIPLKTR